MEFTESELEQTIYEKLKNKEIRVLFDRGLDLYDPDDEIPYIKHIDRQVHLPPYGIADIIVTKVYDEPIPIEGRHVIDHHLAIDIIELKAEGIKSKHFDQVFKYKKAIERYYEQKLSELFEIPILGLSISTILIGPHIDCGHYIHNETGVSIYTYVLNPVDGITFTNESNCWVKEESEKDIQLIDGSLRILDCLKFVETEKNLNLRKNGGGTNG